MHILNDTITKIERIDFTLAEKTQKRLDNLTKPRGSLGRLESLAKQFVDISGNENPPTKNKIIFTLAADHGIADEGVSAYPKDVTAQMVYNFLKEGAGINVLARHIGARVIVVDMGVASEIQKGEIKGEDFRDKKISFGTKNMIKGPAMGKDEAIRSIEAGIEVFEEELQNGIDIVGTGDMGIGNTTSSSAIASVITGRPVEDTTGKGTGVNDKSLNNKIVLIKEAIRLNMPDPVDAIDVLSKVGGFEIGGLAGIILAAAKNRIPVVIDGFISGAASLIACQLEPKVRDYMIAAHCSAEKGHKVILEYMGLDPLLDLGLCLGEGTGAALGISLVEASEKILTQMATFQSASVSERIEE